MDRYKETVTLMLKDIVATYPDLTAQYFRNGKGELLSKTFSEFRKEILAFAIALKEMDVEKDSLVGLLAENRWEWGVADFAIMSLRAADVPRGRDITDQEIEIIYGTTECSIVIVEREQELKRVLPAKLPKLKYLIVLDESADVSQYSKEKVKVLNFHQVLAENLKKVEEKAAEIESIIDEGKKEDLATIIFTSGTTGMPKGVQLTQHNYVNQAYWTPKIIDVHPGEVWLTILPVWHSFERTIQYVSHCNGLALAYSRPIGSVMMQDFKEVNPHFTTAVPRIWESVYNSINKKVNASGGIKKFMFNYFTGIGRAYVSMNQRVTGTKPRFKWSSRILDFILCLIPMILLWPGKKLGDVLVFKTVRAIFGNRFLMGISGGGSLQKKIDKFFVAANITLLEGYGLTESGPVLAVRKRKRPEAGTVGAPFPGMEISIRREDGTECKPGEKGVLYGKGCHIMKGYYKNPELTAEILSEDGWLNSGDLAIWTYDNTYAIVGRAKDTVVLLGGENIEPVPIEKNLSSHPMIDNIAVVGQDQKYLGALIVPNFEAIEEVAEAQGWSYSDREELLKSPEINEYYRSIVVDTISAKNGFKSFEQIYKFCLLGKAFEVNRELSAKQELKRHKIDEFYSKEIAQLFE